MYVSSSPCTKRFQRSTRSCAPFSGWLLHCCALTMPGANSDPVAAPAATPADVFRNLRRLPLILMSPPGCVASPANAMRSRGETPPRGRVEKMAAREVRLQHHALAGMQGGAITHHRGEVLAIELAIQLRVRARRLHDDHFDRQPPIRRRAVLGTDAEENRLPLLRARVRRDRQRDAS